MGFASSIALSFLAGLFAPLGAVCVLPLYPGFLAYLANQTQALDKKSKIITLSLLTALGVILSLFLVGLIFTAVLSSSLTGVIAVLSPIAFSLLAVISLLLIFGFNFAKILPQKTAPVLKNPYLSALSFGAFFGLIVLPCNPASLAVLFALSTSVMSFLTNLLGFIAFGVGMALPLVLLAVISAQAGQNFISWLTKHKRPINVVAGVIMLVISLYYLIFVFRIFG